MKPVDPTGLAVGQTIPIDIYDLDGRLLAREGYRIEDLPHLQLLVRQGMVLEDDESVPEEDEAMPPPEPEPPPQRPRPAPLPPVKPFKELEALVVDDVDLAQNLMTKMLRSMGFRTIRVANNGEAGLRAFDAYHPDIVFLDIDMPRMDGLEALTHIKEHAPQAFVTLVSANSTLANVQRAIANGANGFIVKPYNFRKVREIVEKFRNGR